MAKIKGKQASQRIRLERAIPLETPLELQLAVASVCNFRCTYCPCSRLDLLKKYNIKKGVMSFELYKKIIDDLDEFPGKIKVLRLLKEGEPLLNKKFVDMVRYAKEKQPEVKVDTTTNASLLTPELSDAIIDAGLDKLFISLQGINAEAFKRLAGVNVDFDKLLKNVIYFCEHRKKCKVYIKVPDIGVNEIEKNDFFKIFDSYADELFVERIVPVWPNFDISAIKKDDGLGLYGKPVEPKYIKVCPIIFYTCNINYDGETDLCPADWLHKTSLGNVKKESLYKIWNGQKYNELRIMHLRGKRALHPLCGKCTTVQYCNVDNIDAYAEELLPKFDSLP
ncbi:MAG: radical SAM protein [Candidatus Saganbacteria bacterium]|nr:radical SAM protein [Candidatus Saganbacteria bacterium]